MVELSYIAESDFSLHDARVPRRQPSTRLQALVRGTQRIVSVNYLFGRPLIPYDFLKGIFTSNFRDMGHLRRTNVVSGIEKRSAKIFGKEIIPKVFGKWPDKIAQVISQRLKFP